MAKKYLWKFIDIRNPNLLYSQTVDAKNDFWRPKIPKEGFPKNTTIIFDALW